MYVGATGLEAYSQDLSVIGNNIANVNTTGFKSSDVSFENLMSETVTTGSSEISSSQVGLGVGVSAILLDVNQGSLEGTNSSTDLAISGDGYFSVVDGDETYYTRAGNFLFDSEGYLVTSSGYQVQGQQITDDGNGETTSIQLELNEQGQVIMDPSATSQVSVITNLSSDAGSYSDDEDSPYFALLSSWDDSAEEPISSGSYAYSTTMDVYDENGETHTLTFYFDKVGSEDGTTYWEYVAGFDSSEMANSGSGLVMAGTLAFDSSGALTDQTSYTLQSGASATSTLSNWGLSAISTDGYAQFDVAFAGTGSNASTTSTIAVDFGLQNTSGAWSSGAAATAGAVGSSASALPSFNGTQESLITTGYSGTSSTTYTTQDGYGTGYLTGVSVDEEGIISGQFSNGEQDELWQVTLYDFASEWGLRSEGGNLYSATSTSGDPIEGYAGEEGFGSVYQGYLETSNVDMTDEFVDMIVAQRSFEANSKIITTEDSVLQTALAMKK
jgi:flagellar hook protein FlgE